MRQKLLIAQGELRDVLTLAQSNRNERGIRNRVHDALSAIDDSIITLDVLEAGKHYAN